MLAFIDESGTHTLTEEHIDAMYSVFVLGAAIFTNENYEKFDSHFRKLKIKFFGTDKFVIHTAEITRPSKARDPLNKKFNDSTFRMQFYKEVGKLIDLSDFSVVSCVIKKYQHFQKLGPQAPDPYIFSFGHVLDGILSSCKDGDTVEIYPEKRGYVEDTKLELSYLRARVTGTESYRGVEVAEKVNKFQLADKSENMSGQQLIDLLVTPIGRHVMGKSAKPRGNEIFYSLISTKMEDTHSRLFPVET